MSLSWQPTASIQNLKTRAALLRKIREFFAARQVMEVETPLLCHTSVPDPYILSIPANVRDPHSGKDLTCYLQTSPEYAMKRLLAAGSGSIYQLCKAFRQDELGRIHNPEFTILEWYRLDFDHHLLMDEISELFKVLMPIEKTERFTYAELFQKYLQLNPHTESLEMLEACARQHVNLELKHSLSRDGWLQILMSEVIETQIGQDYPTFVYDFPASQASLARVRPENPPVASRFEVYYRGIELGNGFHELQSEPEQRMRFLKDLEQRAAEGVVAMPLDERLLAALKHGLPACAGIALGVDRLLMLASNLKAIEEIMSFNFATA
jgi:lysyl-tRNA synthetase class 2